MAWRSWRGAPAWALKAAVTGGLLAYVFLAIPLAEVLRAFGALRAAEAAAAVLLLMASRVVAAARVKLLTDKQGMSLSLWQTVEIGYSTAFYGLLLPGSLSAGAVRWYKLAQQDQQPTGALVVIAFDRWLDTIGFVALGGACWFLGHPSAPHRVAGWLFALILSALLLVHLTLFNAAVSGRILARLRRRDWSWLPPPIRGKLRALVAALGQYHDVSGRFLSAVTALSLAVPLLGVVSLALLGRSLGLSIPLVDLGWIRTCLVLMAMLPIAIAGIGVNEGALVLMLAPLGISGAQAVALSLLRFGSWLVVALVGGALELKSFLLAPGRRVLADPRPGP